MADPTPPDAAPMREDVTQADRDRAKAAMMEIWGDCSGFGRAMGEGKMDSHKLVQSYKEHRLAHTARPGAGDEVEQLRAALKPFAALADEWDRWQAKGSTSAPAMVKISYGRVRVELQDHQNARAALAAMREGVDRGMVERVIDQAQFLCDRLDNLDFSMDMEDFAREHAGHVDPAHSRLKDSLAALSRKGG